MADISPEFGETVPHMTYQEFKQTPLKDIVPGSVITDISPAKLFATQDWVDLDRVESAYQNGEKVALRAPVWVADVPLTSKPGQNQRVIVLGDMHHRSLKAWSEGKKIEGSVVGNLPEGKRIMSFSRYRMAVGDPFRDIE